MKIISYNVNGIRAAITKGFLEWLQQANPDVICLQEIKATEDQIPKLEIEAAGYPYQYYFPAEKKGYSGLINVGVALDTTRFEQVKMNEDKIGRAHV